MTSDEEHGRRLREVLSWEEEHGETGWYYTSFAGERGFLGAAVVLAFGPADAIRQCWRLGINPGGESMTWRVPDGAEIKDEWKHRLLSREDMERLGLGPVRMPDDMERD